MPQLSTFPYVLQFNPDHENTECHINGSVFFAIICSGKCTQKTISSIVQREDKLILNLTSDNWGYRSSSIKSKPLRSRGFSFLLMNERMNKTGNFGFGSNYAINGYYSLVDVFKIGKGPELNPYSIGISFTL